MTRIAVLVSGGGTNLQALIDAEKEGKLGGGEIALVISSKPKILAIERAKKAKIKYITIERKKYANTAEFDNTICVALTDNNIDLVILAGFVCVLGKATLNEFKNQIINIHPALLPAFGGKGFYGLRVHEEVLKSGAKKTGATVHFVNELVDGGKIILQKEVAVLPDDTPETLQQRVMREAEWVLLPKAVEMFCKGEIK